MYVHGKNTGITNETSEHEDLCRYINSWVKRHAPPKFAWTSIAVNVQTAARIHVDKNNESSSSTMTTSFGPFTKGELWLEMGDGDTAEESEKIVWKDKHGFRTPGVLRNTWHNPFLFRPKRYHATMPWKGVRVSVSVHCPKIR